MNRLCFRKRSRLFATVMGVTFAMGLVTASAHAQSTRVRAKTKTAAERQAAVISLTNRTGLKLGNLSVVKKDGFWQTKKLGPDGQPVGKVRIKSQKIKSGATARTNESGVKTKRKIAGTQPRFPLDKQMAKAKPLKGKSIVVVVESQFIPQELALYVKRFAAYGAKVEFVTRLWGNERLAFHSHFDEGLVPEVRHMYVSKDISQVNVASGNVAAVIAPIDVNQRLLFDPGIPTAKDPVAATAKAPAVQLMKEALKNPNVVVGAFGHGAELLAPLGKTIKGAKFTASPGSVVHLQNAGAKYSPAKDPQKWNEHVVTEKGTKAQPGLNLVTGTSLLGSGQHRFIDAVARRAMEVQSEPKAGARSK